METIISIILLVFGILQIILFFKIWGMTNDVENIYKLLESKCREVPERSHPIEETQESISAPTSEETKPIKTEHKFNKGDFASYLGEH